MDMTQYNKDSSIKRIVTGRIKREIDLLTGIKEICKLHGLRHGYIASIIASLKRGRFIYAVKR